MIHMRWLQVLAVAPILFLNACKPDNAVQRSAEMDATVAAQQARERAASEPLTKEEAIRTNDGRPVIACFGDSLTAGYGTNEGESYPDQLQHQLDQAGYHYRVVNLGISGETTKDGLSRVDRVMALHPSIVVLEFGGNDGLRGVPVENTQSNLDALLHKLQAAQIHVALLGITLPPQYGKQYIQNFDAMYPTEAKKYNVPLLPFLYKDVYGVPGSIQADGIHATAQGNRQVAKNVFTFLLPMLQR